MAQSQDSSTEIVNKMLKVDGRGWNISLFEDAHQVSNCLCAHCGTVCCDTVELGCDHNENDIFLYCHICLSELIKKNDNKCMINGHYNPPLDAARAIRRQISKSIVACPYSTIFKTRNTFKKNNDDAEVIDTLGGYDEKEGHIPAAVAQLGNDVVKLEQKCEWKGILSELIGKHIIECTKKNDPTFTLNIRVKELENENILLQQRIVNLENQNQNTQKELNNKNEENKKLKEVIQEKQAKMNMSDNENKNLMHELNKIKTNITNNQKQSSDMNNEIKKLKAIIGDKEIQISKLKTKLIDGNQNQNAINQFKKTQKELDNRINYKNEENKKLKAIIQEKQTEMNALGNENKNLTNELNKIKTNAANNQKQSNDNNNEITKLKAIIGDKEIEINSQSLIIKDFLKSTDEKNKLIKLLQKEIKNNSQKEEKKQDDIIYITDLNQIDIFKQNKYCITDLNNSIFTTQGKCSLTEKTYGIIQIEWSKDQNNGIHQIKLKCLQSASNAISIGMVTNNKTKTNDWLFDSQECGISYQLWVNNKTTEIYHHKNGKQQYQEIIPNRKPISDKWTYNTYGPNETMEMKVDLNKLELMFVMNSKQIGKTIRIQSNTYYPAIVYGVWNGDFSKYGPLKVKLLSLC